ncbi:MAG: uracil-DNA glycosylase, partial [Lentisphaeria bacterium]|nr:uracil-DNA glycosylase [Lentisphaeria bacterium]
MPGTLEHLAATVRTCRGCPLCETRLNAVPGEGNPHARLMFIGEGPGADEDRQGRPFVGAAGQLLDKMILAMQFKREDVYIANIVKCRPP